MGKWPVTGRKSRRSTMCNALVIGGNVAVLLLLMFAGEFTVQNVSAEAEQKTQAADKIAVPIAATKKQLEALAQDEAIVKLFAEADSVVLESEGEEKRSLFESALKLRLLFPGKYETDREAMPPMSFASVDLLRRAEKSATSMAAEVHGVGGDGVHIALVNRVTDVDDNLVGLLHLSMPLSLIESITSTFDVPGTYIEIQQGKGAKAFTLAMTGDAKLRIGKPIVVGIKGTKWNVVSWSKSRSSAASVAEAVESVGGDSSIVLIVLVLLVLVAGAGGFVFYRRKQSGTKTDTGKAKSKDTETQEEKAEEGVVYQGAVKAIMEGEHPGLARLIPGLPQSGEETVPGAISQGLQGDDVTAIFKPSEILPDAPAQVPKQENVVQSTDDAQQAGIIAPKKDNSEAAEQENTDRESPETTPAKAVDSPDVEVPEQVEISPGIFRAYDIRGVVGETLSAAIVREIGRAIGSEANERGQQGIVVARDGRTSSPELGDALIEGLCASGRDVTDIGVVPTPVLYFATHHLETNSGVMLTGSHNGPEYNGLKIVLDGETLFGEAITAIRNRITNKEMTEGQGSLQATDISADYLRRITDDIPVALGGAFKIIVDCGNGVAGKLAPQLYRAMGHDVVELFCDIDGNFPNHQPDPSQPENLQSLIEIVKEEGADLGFAFDGDGDRLGIVDGEGNIIWPDRQMMLFARDVLSRNKGASIIFDVKCSRHLKAIIKACGGKPLMWKTGHSLIKSKMKEIDAPLAGEFSGHIFFKERWYGFDDALYAGARALEILTNSKGSPTETFAELPKGISTPELRIPLAEKHHAKVMEIIKKKMTFEDVKVIDIDGLRVDFSDGWGLVRASNTSPFLVARFEADSDEAMERIQKGFHDLLHSVSADLKLPF